MVIESCFLEDEIAAPESAWTYSITAPARLWLYRTGYHLLLLNILHLNLGCRTHSKIKPNKTNPRPLLVKLTHAPSVVLLSGLVRGSYVGLFRE